MEIKKSSVAIGLACLSICISYADRSNISIAIVPMSKDLDFSLIQRGAIFSSFFYGYGATQILGGYFADQLSGNYILATGTNLIFEVAKIKLKGVFVWSLFTLLTPFAARSGIKFLLLCRFLLGFGEGVSFPAIHSMIPKWVPDTKTSTTVAIITSFSYGGSILAFVIGSPIAASESLGWPVIFYIFGCMGLLWIIPWIIFVPNNENLLPLTTTTTSPHSQPSITDNSDTDNGSNNKSSNNKSTSAIPPSPASKSNEPCNESEIPWSRILSNPAVWAIVINQYCNSWGFYILLQWLPSYYEKKFEVDLSNLGFYSLIPFFVQMVFGLFAGLFADTLVNRTGLQLAVVRKGFQIVAMLGAAFFLLLAGFCANTVLLGVIMLTCAMGVNSLTLAGVSVSHIDIGPKYSGLIFGIGNTAATLPGIIGVQLTGIILDKTNGNWSIVFALAAGHYIFGALIWLFFSKSSIIFD